MNYQNNPKGRQMFILDELKLDSSLSYLECFSKFSVVFSKTERTFNEDWKKANLELKQYTETKDGTLFMSLLASWNVLLHHYSGQKDIIFGTPVSAREHADLEDQIGFYVNTLALRNTINSEESFDVLHYKVV